MPARPTSAPAPRLTALLLAVAAVAVAVLSPLLGQGLLHRTGASLIGSPTRVAAPTSAARGVDKQTIERGPSVTLQAAAPGTSTPASHPLAVLLGAALALAAAGRLAGRRVRSGDLRGQARAARRDRGPPRGAARLA